MQNSEHVLEHGPQSGLSTWEDTELLTVSMNMSFNLLASCLDFLQAEGSKRQGLMGPQNFTDQKTEAHKAKETCSAF